MEDILNDSRNLFTRDLPVEDALKELGSQAEGLTSDDAQNRLRLLNTNQLELEEGKSLKCLLFLKNPLSLVILLAAVISIAHANNNKDPEWHVFFGIIAILLMYTVISFVDDTMCGISMAELKSKLGFKAKVLRDGRWVVIDASLLVPGDVVSIKAGDIIPADARLLEGGSVQVNESVITSAYSSLARNTGDRVLSGSICEHGDSTALVMATGDLATHGKVIDLLDSTDQAGHFQKIIRAVGSFCIIAVLGGMVVEICLMYLQTRPYSKIVNNVLVLLIGGIPVAMPMIVRVVMAIGSYRLSEQGVLTKRMSAIEQIAGMDVICCDKAGTLTINKLSINKDHIEAIPQPKPNNNVILQIAARASRTRNRDSVDTALVEELGPGVDQLKGVTVVVEFVSTRDRSTITYIDQEGNMFRESRGSPEKILELVEDQAGLHGSVAASVIKFEEKGFRPIAVAYQRIPDGNHYSLGGPWYLIGLVPLFDNPRPDSAETIRRALNLGVKVKMITGDKLAISKEMGRIMGMGTNMYPLPPLPGQLSAVLDDVIQIADGFAEVLPQHKLQIIEGLKGVGYICGMTGDKIEDVPSLQKADIGIATVEACDAARRACDIVLTEPGLLSIVNAVLTSRSTFQRMKGYLIYVVGQTILIMFGFILLSVAWKFDFPAFMVVIYVVINDGPVIFLVKEKVKASPVPDTWKLSEIYATGVALGSYIAMTTIVFFWAATSTDFFPLVFKVSSLLVGDGLPEDNIHKQASAVFLQVSTMSLALKFVAGSQSWCFLERPGRWVLVLLGAQLTGVLIAVYADWNYVRVSGIGWGWAGVILLYNIVTCIPMDFVKFLARYVQSGRAREYFWQK